MQHNDQRKDSGEITKSNNDMQTCKLAGLLDVTTDDHSPRACQKHDSLFLLPTSGEEVISLHIMISRDAYARVGRGVPNSFISLERRSLAPRFSATLTKP